MSQRVTLNKRKILYSNLSRLQEEVIEVRQSCTKLLREYSGCRDFFRRRLFRKAIREVEIELRYMKQKIKLLQREIAYTKSSKIVLK